MQALSGRRALNGHSDNCFSKGSAKNLLLLSSFYKKHVITTTVLIAKLIKGRKLSQINKRKAVKHHHIAYRRGKKSESQLVQISASPLPPWISGEMLQHKMWSTSDLATQYTLTSHMQQNLARQQIP